MSFLDDLKKETAMKTTENGAKTYETSLNDNLDFFAQAGAIRERMEDSEQMFIKAYSEDRELALRNMSYLRDIREGLGEREAFRRMVNKLIDTETDVAVKFLKHIPELGRWDDLVEAYFHAKNTNNQRVVDEAGRIIAVQLIEDYENMEKGNKISLMVKWLPSPSVKNKRRKKQANMLAHDLEFGVSSYRKVLSQMRRYLQIVETKLSEKDYDTIEFEKLPSRALFKYRQAFERHMEEKYDTFIEKVNNGEVKMNASNVLPYEIVKNYTNEDSWGWDISVKDKDAVLEATWKSLDDTIGEAEENAIVVADTSGSMIGDPWYVAQSLAIYSAERLKGAFANNFITFSTRPQLVQLPTKGSLRDKLVEYNKYSIVENTDIGAVFELILRTATKAKTLPEDLPSKIIIISDLEFDMMSHNNGITVFENAKEMYELAGYNMPNVVFWNVNSRANNLPVQHNEQGVALVSGLTPNIFKQILLKDFISPEQVMLDTIMQERYDFVKEILN